MLLPAPYLSPVAPICSYVDDKNVPSVVYGLLTLAVVGLGSGGGSDSRASSVRRRIEILNKPELFAWYNVSSDGDNRKVAKGVGRNR